jgi:predicted dehydrogenase
VKGSMGAVAAMGFPAIVPASVFGQTAPSNRINVGAIGVGRISRGHDLPGIWQFDQAQIMAVCDLDAKRVDQAKSLINGVYSKKTGNRTTASPDTITITNCWPTKTLMRW